MTVTAPRPPSWTARAYKWWMTPCKGFDETAAPEAPDYIDHGPRSWAAFPGRAGNAAELRPEGEEGEALSEDRRPVDCFFLYPTTFGILSGGAYNAPLDDCMANAGIDVCLATQASAFNKLCRIYAPRFRQVALGVWGPERENASELAYGDVKRAFTHFIESLSGGRPFIIASHSQGTRLALRLLTDCVEGTPLADRFIAGYLIGGWLPLSAFDTDLRRIHPSQGPTDSCCVIGWDTVPSTFDRTGRAGPSLGLSLATHPLTWVSNGGELEGQEGKKAEAEAGGAAAAGPESKHRGLLLAEWGWARKAGRWVPSYSVKGLGRPVLLDQEAFDVEVDRSFVVVPPVRIPGRGHAAYTRTVFGGTYHLVDYALFYYDIRHNAEERIGAFLERKRA